MARFKQLRERYIGSSLARVEQLETSLDRLAVDLCNAALIEDVMRHFHGFAGLGGTYGFHNVSEVAKTTERRLNNLLRKELPIDGDDITALREALAIIRNEYRNAPPPEGDS